MCFIVFWCKVQSCSIGKKGNHPPKKKGIPCRALDTSLDVNAGIYAKGLLLSDYGSMHM